MRILRQGWLTFLIIALTAQLAFAVLPGDPALTVSGGETLTVNTSYTVTDDNGITAIGDGNTIIIETSGNLNAPSNAGIYSEGAGQTIIVDGSISAATPVDLYSADGGSELTSSGTITSTSSDAIKMSQGDDTVTIQAGSNITGHVALAEGNDTLKLLGAELGTSIYITGSIKGGPGNDLVESMGNIETTEYIVLGHGDDTLHIKTGTLRVLDSSYGAYLNYGEDTLIIEEGATLELEEDAYVRLKEDNDTAIIKGTITDRIAGGPGDDRYDIYTTSSVEDLCAGDDDDTLNFYGDGEGTIYAAIEDFETINKYDAGTWTFTDTSTGSDNETFTIFEGGLVINSSFTVDDLILENGTMLSGTGGITGNIDNSGSVTPGNSIGIFNVDGNYTQTTDGKLVIEIGNGASDLLDVSGEADISGTLDVQIVDRIMDGETYTFLTTGSGLYGEFDTVLGSAFYVFDITYDTNDASLDVTGLSYSEVGLDGDEAAFMEELEDMAGHGVTEAQDALKIILNEDTTSQAKGAIGSLSPQMYPNLIDISMAGFELYGNTVMGRMGNLHLTRGIQDTQYATNTVTEQGPSQARIPAFENQAQGWSSWARVIAMTGDQDGEKSVEGYDFNTAGISFGFDNKVNDTCAIGIGAGYATSDVDFDESGQDTDVDSYHLGIYGTHSNERYYIDTAVFYADSDFDSDRDNAVSHASSSTDGTEWGIYLGGGYTMLDTEAMYFMPTISIQYAQVDVDGFNEKGTGLLYSVDDYDADSTVTTLGFRWGGKMIAKETRFEPELRIAWAHEFGDTDRDVKASFIGPPTPTTFTVDGVEPDEDSLLVGLGVNFYSRENITIYLDYDGEFRSDFDGHALSAGLRYNF